MSRPKSATPREPDVRVEFLATIEPTATDRTRYRAGTAWTMPAARARALAADGVVKLLTAPPARVPKSTAAAPRADEE